MGEKIDGRSDIPEHVRSLIRRQIDSVAELEAILLLRKSPEREWSADQAGARLYVSPAVAAYVLAMLARKGFFEEQEDCYRYAPVDPELRRDVDDLAQIYSIDLVSVTNLIHAKPGASVLEFARAFQLRRDK
ncbi:MAG: hypothetical protein ACREK8_08375 [Gemmatimonadales bacterium]